VRSVRLITAFGLGYLLGTVQSADIASRIATGGRVNLRTSGSRNPGAVNAGRVLGPTAGLAVPNAVIGRAVAGRAVGVPSGGDPAEPDLAVAGGV
jgi:glycerol-3-phosphate acyltransferase PlsY